MTRRASLLVLGWMTCCAGGPPPNVRIDSGPSPEIVRLRARPQPVFRPGEPGLHPLQLGTGRDGLLYVPEAARSRRVALVVMLHGAGGSASSAWEVVRREAMDRQVAVLLPESRDWSWRFRGSDFGADGRFIDASLTMAFERVAVEPAQVALAGFSMGATLALSLGPPNGDLFSWIIAFAPTGIEAAGRTGHPRFFVAHGTVDEIALVDRTSRAIVPALRAAGDFVVYREFPAPHAVPEPAIEEAFSLLLSEPGSPSTPPAPSARTPTSPSSSAASAR